MTNGTNKPLDIAKNPEGVVYFCSGSNRSSEVRGLGIAGLNVGVCALEVTSRKTRDYPLTDGTVARCSTALPVLEELRALPSTSSVFIDSGAFSEVKFGATGPTYPKPMGAVEWARVIGFYMRVTSIDARVFVVAPDRVGCQTVTLERMAAHGNAMRQIAALGGNVLVPVQGGALSMGEFYRAATDALGVGDAAIPAIPMKKAATTLEDLVLFVAEVQPRAVHLLGLGPKSRRWRATVDALRAVSPDLEILADSVILRSLVGRTNGRGNGPRALTAAIDAVLEANPGIEKDEARSRGIASLVSTEQKNGPTEQKKPDNAQSVLRFSLSAGVDGKGTETMNKSNMTEAQTAWLEARGFEACEAGFEALFVSETNYAGRFVNVDRDGWLFVDGNADGVTAERVLLALGSEGWTLTVIRRGRGLSKRLSKFEAVARAARIVSGKKAGGYRRVFRKHSASDFAAWEIHRAA